MLVSGARVDREAERGQPVRQPAGVPMIVGEPIDVVLERVQPGRRQDAGLTHAAAEHLADAMDAVDERG